MDDVKALTADELVNVFGMERVEADLLVSALLLEDHSACGNSPRVTARGDLFSFLLLLLLFQVFVPIFRRLCRFFVPPLHF